MATNTERGRAFGYQAAVGAKAVREASPRAAQAAKLYNTTAAGYSYDLAADSYYDRRKARLRDDREGMALANRERQQVIDWAKKHKVPAESLRDALVVMHERDKQLSGWDKDNHRRTPLTDDQTKTIGTMTREALRLELGSTEAVDKTVKGFLALTTSLAQEVPTLAQRANENGAGVDVRVVKALAPYGEAQT